MIKFSHSRQNQNKTYFLFDDGFEFLDNLSFSYQSSFYLYLTVPFTKPNLALTIHTVQRKVPVDFHITDILGNVLFMSHVSFSAALDIWGPLLFSRIPHPPFHLTGIKWCVDLNIAGDCTHLCLALALSSLGEAFFFVPLCLAKFHSLFKFQLRHHLL